MSNLYSLFDTNILQAIGWTILHSIWLITLIGVLLKISLSSKRLRQSAKLRYSFSVSSLLITTLITGGLFWMLISGLDNTPPTELTLTTNSEVVTFNTVSPTTASQITKTTPIKIYSLRQRIESSFPFLIFMWVAGVLILSLRFLGGLWVLHQLKRKGLTAVEQTWLEKVRSFQQQMHISRKVALFYSDRVHQPITVGFFKPLILMPVGLLNQLTTEEVELILLHELAHIRRADYLVNLLQSLVEIMFFYHPVVWWISRQIRESREHCCDDLAIQISKDPKAYALALTRLQKLILLPKIPLAMNISGINFTHRIQRLFGVSQPETTSFWLPGLLFIALSFTAYQTVFTENDKHPPHELEEKVWVFNNKSTPVDLKSLKNEVAKIGVDIEYTGIDTNFLGFVVEVRGKFNKSSGCQGEFMFNVETSPMGIIVNEGHDCSSFKVRKLKELHEEDQLIWGDKTFSAKDKSFKKITKEELARIAQQDMWLKNEDGKFPLQPRVFAVYRHGSELRGFRTWAGSKEVSHYIDSLEAGAIIGFDPMYVSGIVPVKLAFIIEESTKEKVKPMKVQWGTFEWKVDEKPTFLPLQLSFLAKLPMKIFSKDKEYRVEHVNSIVWVPNKQDPVEYLKCDYIDSERIETIIKKGQPGDHYYFEGVKAGSLAPINLVFEVEEPMEDFEGAGLRFLSDKNIEIKERDGLQIIVTKEIKLQRIKDNGLPIPLMFLNGKKISLPLNPSGIPSRFEDNYQTIDSLIQMGPKKAKELLGLEHPTGVILFFNEGILETQQSNLPKAPCKDITFRWGNMEFNGINSILRLKPNQLDPLRSNPIQFFTCGKQQEILSIGKMSLVTKGNDPASIMINDYNDVLDRDHAYHKMLKRLMVDDILYIRDLKVAGGKLYNIKIIVESEETAVNQESPGMSIRVDGHIEYDEDTEILKLFGIWSEIEGSTKPINELPLFYLNGERLKANQDVNNIPEALLGKISIDSIIVFNEKLVKENLGINHEPGAWMFYNSGRGKPSGLDLRDTIEVIDLPRPRTSPKLPEKVVTLSKSSLTVYPNPTSDQTTIEMDLQESAKVKIRVVDFQGKLVQNFGVKKLEKGLHKINWDMQDHPAGVYFVEIQIDDQPLANMKVVKQ